MKTPTVSSKSNQLVPGMLALWAAFMSVAPQAAASTVSYDSDGDGLIEISTLAQLNAIRWDLNGDGAADSGVNASAYTAAFPNPTAGMGCALADHDGRSATPDIPVCTGYELKGDLDFDTDDDGDVDAADEFWHRGSGWEPIGGWGTGNEFVATFDGNGHTVSHLYIRRSSSRVGLFGVVGNGGRVRNLGLLDVDVNGSSRGVIVGGLAGKNAGTVIGCHVTGSVSGTGGGSSEVGGLVGRNGGPSDSGSSIVASCAAVAVTGPSSSFRSRVGGLAGYNYGSIRASYASGTVTGSGNQSYVGGLVGFHNGGSIVVSYASATVTGKTNVGGLVGQNDVSIRASYATGAVNGDDSVGGLVGYNQWGYVRAAYATGWVASSGSDVGGLVGRNQGSGVSNSYWNTMTAGRVSSAAGEGKTTAELQFPGGYTGIYSDWNVDLDNADGDRDATTGGDDPWDFGTGQQYPALRADFDGDGTATWQEFGAQRPDVSPGTETGSTDDATLKALGVSPVDIEGFAADVLDYEIGVANAVREITIVPYLNNEGATVDIDGGAVSSGSGHTVRLSEGRNGIAVTVTAEDSTTRRIYTITAARGSNAPFGWKVIDDFNDLGLTGESPGGVWSDGASIWVSVKTADGADLYRYSMTTKARATSFGTLNAAGNKSPTGIWSDGTTMYVANRGFYSSRIYAYKLSTYAPDPGRYFNTLEAAGNRDPRGIWSDGKTMYVVDGADHKVYAYSISTKARDPYKDLDSLWVDNLTIPYGIWGNGRTLWVGHSNFPELLAYNTTSKSRDLDSGFFLGASGGFFPSGIWSDGTTLWVVVRDKKRIFSYNMPDLSDATLSGLTLSPGGIADFDSDVPAYHLAVANDVTQVSLTPTVNLSGGTIDVDGAPSPAAPHTRFRSRRAETTS